MTEPSNAYRQSQQRSPKELDDRILATAKHQAELNEATRKLGGSNWMRTAAFASVCLVGLSIVFDSQFTEVSDQYSYLEDATSLSEIPDEFSPAIQEIPVAPDVQLEAAPSGFGEVEAPALNQEESIAGFPIEIDVSEYFSEPLADSSDLLESSEVADLAVGAAIEPDFALVEALPVPAELDEISVLEREVALQSEAEEQYLLEEIVVTARSREEPLAEIPVSVSVVEDENRVNSAATTEELLALVRGAALAQTEEEPVRLDTFSAAGEFYDDSISASAVAGIPTPALVNLIDYIPDLVLDIRYFGSNNFVGEPIDGYLAANALLTPQTAQALVIVQQQANAQGLGLKIFDAYRPQRAVNHFVRWAEDLDEQSTKQEYYPNVEKEALFEQGYIAALSGHSRGSTIDLTLINLGDGTELDMGSAFDFFDPISWPSSTEVSEQAQQNRQLLRSLMMEQGFIPYEAEWWHFTLADEPYPDQHFDLLVE